MPVARPVEPSAQRCHGRAVELEQMTCLLHDASAGKGASLALVTGPPSIGKSTLVEELGHHLRQQGALVLESRCAPGLRPLAPVLEITRRAWEHLCSDGVDPGLSGPVDELFDLLQGRPEPRSPVTDRAARRLELYEQLAHLLRLLGDRQPTAVLIHDVDMADRPTRHLLTYLGRSLACRVELTDRPFRGLMVGTARELPQELVGLASSGGVNLLRIDLDGLDADGVRSYLCCDEVVQRVLDLTGGDPSLLEAMTAQTPDHEDHPPLSRATPSEARVLELLAVFGRPLGAETLRLLTGLPLSELGPCIAALTRRRAVDRRVVDGELRVALARAGDQQTLYRTLTRERRRALHARIGEHLSHLGEEELEACAGHLLRGGDADRAVATAQAAGERLERALCFERAIELYEHALSVAGARQAPEICRRLWRVLQLCGQLDRAQRYAERCLEASPDDLDLALELVDLHLRRRDADAAAAALQRLKPGPRAPDTQIRLCALDARARYLAGARQQAREAAEDGLQRLGQLERDADAVDPRLRLSLQNTLGKLCLEDGQPGRASDLLGDNLSRARAAGLAEEATLALIQLGLMALEAQDFELAEERYRQALQLTATVGEHRLRGVCLQHLGVIAERRCRYDLALQRYQEAVNVWKQAWLRGHLSWVALDLGQLYLKLNHLDRARAMVALSERMEGSGAPLRNRINHALLRGRIARHECHYGEADAWFRKAAELAASDEQTARQIESTLELAELRLDQGLHGQALVLLEQTDGAFPHLHVRALLLRGRALLADGQAAQARAPLARALEQGDALPDPETSWRARYLLARVAMEQGRESEARRLLVRAARVEAQVRAHVPAELAGLVAEQPLRRGLEHALLQRGGMRDAAALRPPAGAACFNGMVGRAATMQQVYVHVEKVATTDTLVLIRGESGTGKELVADAIHRRSHRSSRPLVKVNCGALVESLLLSELFGHERGAFTGATERRKGRFEAADGGTIFLDEIGDISPATQVALLRVLQQQEFERVGGTRPIRVDVRIICATNRDLEQLVARGAFREDLYYRLRGFVVDVPPLRERVEDLTLLCDHFLAAVARERDTAARRLDPAALRLLRRHRWPGNVRELENVLRSVSLLSDNEVLQAADFADYMELNPVEDGEDGGAATPLQPYEHIRRSGIGLREYKKQIEHDCIVEALQESGGSIAGAARLLGIKRPRLSQLVKEHSITVHRDR